MAPPAIGGVCAHLDYEVDQMADYVAEMAQRLVMGNAPVSPAFRKFCSGLLSSTRLPSTTILLGMNYLARRMNYLNSVGPYNATDGQVWRMLTIGLLLGSKFLDDNTFQNRSWSEVSSIPVAELNTLENEWLVSMDWKLYVNLDESKDFNAWIQSWNDWREQKNVQRANTLDRLAPLSRIDTEVLRVQTQYGAKYTASHPNPQIRDANRYDPFYDQPKTNWHQYPTPHCTPPTNRNSALNSPLEQMSATGGAPRYNDWSLYTGGYSRGYQQQVQPAYNPRVATFHTPYTNHYAHQYNGNGWESHGINCECCTPQVKQPFFMGYGGYGQQITA